MARLGRPRWWLRVMQAASASSLTAIRAKRLRGVRAPWRSRLSRSLQVQKTDSIRCLIGARWGACLRLGRSGWTDDGAAECRDGGRELAAGVALVADDRLAAGERARQQRQRDLALGPVSGDQGSRAGCPIRRA